MIFRATCLSNARQRRPVDASLLPHVNGSTRSCCKLSTSYYPSGGRRLTTTTRGLHAQQLSPHSVCHQNNYAGDRRRRSLLPTTCSTRRLTNSRTHARTGLDNAGKSSIINRLLPLNKQSFAVPPTAGYNVE
jgi:ribosome biogenesis GTPase A